MVIGSKVTDYDLEYYALQLVEHWKEQRKQQCHERLVREMRQSGRLGGDAKTNKNIASTKQE